MTNSEQKIKNRRNRRTGLALLSVLFIVFAVTVVVAGFLYRSDMALASGHSLCARNQGDYLAWAGLEHARAYIQSYDTAPLVSGFPITLGAPIDKGNFNYEVLIDGYSISAADPNIYVYTVSSETSLGNNEPRSNLSAAIAYDPNDSSAEFLYISRE